jgi:DNA-binding NarL/FixJ family response regulator
MMVAAHKTDKQIATALGIGVRTVRGHIAHIVAAWNLSRDLNVRTQIAERVPKRAA